MACAYPHYMQQQEGNDMPVDHRIWDLVDRHLKTFKIILNDEQLRCYPAIKGVESLDWRNCRPISSGCDRVKPTHQSHGSTEQQKHEDISTGNHQYRTDNFLFSITIVEENKI